MAKANQAQNQT